MQPIAAQRTTFEPIFDFDPSFPLASLITNFPRLMICEGKAFKVEREVIFDTRAVLRVCGPTA
jgi:hypothetical protein